jgi:hypothetical protein
MLENKFPEKARIPKSDILRSDPGRPCLSMVRTFMLYVIGKLAKLVFTEYAAPVYNRILHLVTKLTNL